MKRLHESLLPFKGNKHYMFVCMGAICVGVRAGTRDFARVALLIQHARRRHIVNCNFSVYTILFHIIS